MPECCEFLGEFEKHVKPERRALSQCALKFAKKLMSLLLRPIFALLFVISALGVEIGCSDKGTSSPQKESPPPDPSANSETTLATAPAAPATAAADAQSAPEAHLPPGPLKIARTALETRLKTGADGNSQHWQGLGHLEVKSEQLRELYKSRGKTYIGFKAVVVSDRDCLVDWRAELIASPTGRGPSLGTIVGLTPLPAKTAVTLSGVFAATDNDLKSLASASAGYWTLCGKSMPTPNVHALQILKTNPEDLHFGSSMKLHHTEFVLKGKAPKNQRCFFDLVNEDTDKDGFTLNRDFATFSLAHSAPKNASPLFAKLRRTSFEGGSAKDYEKLAAGNRAYLRNLRCVSAPSPDKTNAPVGIEVSRIALHAKEGKPSRAEHLARKGYTYSAHFKNTLGKDCSFQIRFRLQDQNGLPLHHSSLLSEIVHLKADADLDYTSDVERLFVWLSQVPQVGELTVEYAAPVSACSRFDPAKAL